MEVGWFLDERVQLKLQELSNYTGAINRQVSNDCAQGSNCARTIPIDVVLLYFENAGRFRM